MDIYHDTYKDIYPLICIIKLCLLHIKKIVFFNCYILFIIIIFFSNISFLYFFFLFQSEEYVQTGPGTIYAFSTRTFKINDHILPYYWNHSIYYDETLEGMPFPTQRLYANGIGSFYDEESGDMYFNISASIGRGLFYYFIIYTCLITPVLHECCVPSLQVVH